MSEQPSTIRKHTPLGPTPRPGLLSRDRNAIYLLLLAGLVVFGWCGLTVAAIRFIGFGDPAGYATIAQSILDGRGFEVDYISMHFRMLDPSVTHPEDTWPPLYALFIVPFLAFLGKSALAAKLPSLLVACFGLPVATFGLARQVSPSRAVALAAGLTALLIEPIHFWSLQATADVTFGCLSICALICFLKGLRRPGWFYAMGMILALAYHAKASALFIAAAAAIYYLGLRLFRRKAPTDPPRRDLHFMAALVLCAFLLVPWLVRNQIVFDDPFYSNHKHVAGYVGWEPWEKNTYALYWNREPPTVLTKFSEPGRMIRKGAAFFADHLWMLFMRTDPERCLSEPSPRPPFSFGDFTAYGIGWPALLGLGLLLFRAGRTRRLSVEGPSSEALEGAQQEISRRRSTGYGLFLVAGLLYILIHSLLWVPHARLTIPLLPLIAIGGWDTIFLLGCLAFRNRRMPSRAGGIVVLILCGFWAVAECRDLQAARAERKFPYHESGLSLMEIGDWVKMNAPGAVILTENPWALHYYSGARTVRLPEENLEGVFKAARHFGATHIIPDGFDPVYIPWVRGSIPGLKRVKTTPGLELFEIDYEAISTRERRRAGPDPVNAERSAGSRKGPEESE